MTEFAIRRQTKKSRGIAPGAGWQINGESTSDEAIDRLNSGKKVRREN